MPDWSAGYVADIGYTFGTYAELNPQRIRLAFLNAGLVPPETGVACELGFGQGMSVNVNAAASTTTWYGTDFNPSQAAFARELAAVSGADAHLYDQSFAQFCSREDLPEFDFIGLHGIFSWISDENRAIIIDFISRKLKVGGVLYISYNTQPGWSTMAPIRDLLTEHANVMSAPGSGSAAKVDQSLAFIERLLATEPRYLAANPAVKSRLEKIKAQDHAYVAHEFFNRDWLPFTFSQMARWLESAKLTFACSAYYLDSLDMINLTAEQRKFLGEISDPVFAQTVRDVMVNQSFRRDYWVRGARKLDPVSLDERMMPARVMLLALRDTVSLKTSGSLGEVTLNDNVYRPILDKLQDNQPHTVRELVEHGAATAKLSRGQVLQAVFVLVGMGTAAMVQDDDTVERARPQAQKLNLHLCSLARSDAFVRQLAAPAIGGPVSVDRFNQLFILSRDQGGRGPEEWAAFAMAALARLGQRLKINGELAKSDEEQLRELFTQAVAFRDRTLPILLQLGVIA